MITSHKKKVGKEKCNKKERSQNKKRGKKERKKLFAWPGGEPKYMHSTATDGIST